MKKILCIVMCLTVLLINTACRHTGTTAEVTTQSPAPILYRVSNSQGHCIYLFGSIHVGIEEMYPLPDYVLSAYSSADVLTLETSNNYSFEEMNTYNQAIMLDGGTTIRDYISINTYNTALQILKDGNAYTESMEQKVPMLWFEAINKLLMTKGDSTPLLGVDLMLLKMAKKDNKPIEAAESYRSHTAINTDLNLEMQCQLLDLIVQTYQDPAIGQKLDNLCTAWASGDLEALEEQISSDPYLLGFSADEMDNYEEFDYLIRTSRNLEMANYVKASLASGKTAFICVGIAHVIGEQGIVELLSQEGYTVERL